ncbi:MAG: hypothetical protein DMG40_23205 [Acidobacteria bacterium]|nr:MAG: hypothetical protein DMG40_23205 [Acidobacteriota bacterium]
MHNSTGSSLKCYDRKAEIEQEPGALEYRFFLMLLMKTPGPFDSRDLSADFGRINSNATDL